MVHDIVDQGTTVNTPDMLSVTAHPASKRPVLKVCVSCGSERVQGKKVSVCLRDGRTVTGVKADVRAACGERYFDLEAMRRLEPEGTHDQ